MKSREEKMLQGTYRKDKDRTLGIELKGEIVDSIEPPVGLSEPVLTQWNNIIPYICGLGIVWPSDIPSLYQAWQLLQDIYDAQEEMDKHEVSSDEWEALSKNKYKAITLYQSIMAKFFASPKDRVKAIVLSKKSEEANKSPVDKILERK